MNILSCVQITLRNRRNRNHNSTQTNLVAVTEAGNPVAGANPGKESTGKRYSPRSAANSTSLSIIDKKVETNDGPPWTIAALSASAASTIHAEPLATTCTANSWGNSWGYDGYIRIARDVAAKEGECGIAMMASYPLA
ncbi:hypothetical protein RJ640_006024 [Escallonia rubra]|uniref:Peptidase C1A papain C-terminal domain-containing protein n=1 Tax=Escallonia rubra TaxID=112253 RepID=A0AA88UAS6_9ASTE|nr:hypothetical protein RJ640_006024 [Escallonia rubra]